MVIDDVRKVNTIIFCQQVTMETSEVGINETSMYSVPFIVFFVNYHLHKVLYRLANLQ